MVYIFYCFIFFCIDFRKKVKSLPFFLFRGGKWGMISAFSHLLHGKSKSVGQQTAFCCTAKSVLLPNKKEYATGILALVGRIKCFQPCFQPLFSSFFGFYEKTI